ncbi:SH3 domain-containing protein [Oceanobacillus sp. FSL K6-2867]|uniref:SH3 domain-containing protein n=1 Tax=Oceanobacillus sp. FSL K6-2867 TaxID=2954748 RepID=UPI0030D8836E
MDRKKGIIFTILLIFSALFIAFVAIMQHNFMNPDFAASEKQSMANTALNSSATINEAKNDKSSKSPSDDNEKIQTEDEEESEEITYSTRTVTADLLNARSGPGTDYDIVGIVTIDQEVEVEDDGSEWVKITTPDFTGYVNEKYLSEED